MSAHNYDDESSREVHVRLYGSEAKIVSNELKTIQRACKFLGLTLSEFTRMSVFKEARRTLLDYQKDKVIFAKKILLEEELKQKKAELDNAKEIL
jgi:uncharacterized protein (DUF1778 family)